MFNQNCIDFSDDWKISINHLTFQDLRVNFELLLQNIKDVGKKVSLWLQVTRHFVLLKFEWIIAMFSRKSDSRITNVHMWDHYQSPTASQNCSNWPSSLSTIQPIDHPAYQPSSLLTIKPIDHRAYRPLSLSTIEPIDHQAYWPLTHWAYWPSSR